MPTTATLLRSINPATGETVWQGPEATPEQLDRAIESAAAAFDGWAHAPLQARLDALWRFSAILRERMDFLSEALSQETGKPLWEARAEFENTISKVSITVDAYQTRASSSSRDLDGAVSSVTHHRPHGVLAVISPYNLPVQIAHAQIIPALLAGNTVVHKPSELTPAISELVHECWLESDLPEGVVGLVQGGSSLGQALATHPLVRGLFFTGSAATGMGLARLVPPDRVVALEMGGNNPLIVAEVEDILAAAYLVLESAFLSAGQRCTCARRLILPQGAEGDDLLSALDVLIDHLLIGPFTDEPEPFMGPLIRSEAAARVEEAEKDLLQRGATAIRKLQRNQAFLRPGVLDVTEISQRPDREIFGPLLQVARVTNFHAAIREANHTAFGLTAGLLSDNRALFQHVLRGVRAGVISWNVPLTEASAWAPFGGIGQSGNFHPMGYYAIDSCTYPVACRLRPQVMLPEKLKPGIQL
jgi:succinylglutamic semialdehyde dehydrogenase